MRRGFIMWKRRFRRPTGGDYRASAPPSGFGAAIGFDQAVFPSSSMHTTRTYFSRPREAVIGGLQQVPVRPDTLTQVALGQKPDLVHGRAANMGAVLGNGELVDFRSLSRVKASLAYSVDDGVETVVIGPCHDPSLAGVISSASGHRPPRIQASPFRRRAGSPRGSRIPLFRSCPRKSS